MVECVKQEVGAGASAEEVASAVVLCATQGGSGVVRVARVKGGDEVVLRVNPEVLREVCRMLTAGAGDEAQGSLAEYTFAVEVLDAEEAVAAEFGRAERVVNDASLPHCSCASLTATSPSPSMSAHASSVNGAAERGSNATV